MAKSSDSNGKRRSVSQPSAVPAHEPSVPDLLYCPCCASSAVFLHDGPVHFPWRASCVSKSCALTTRHCTVRELVAAIWNRRLKPKPAKRRL